jgi:hypothetical protein
MLNFRPLDLIAQLIATCEALSNGGPGHPHSPTVRVVATLRRFLRDGLPWCSLCPGADQASGSTLQRFLACWAESATLAKVRALLVAIVCGDPMLILDSCPVRAKRGGDLVGPNSTDWGKIGTKYHLAVHGGVCLHAGRIPCRYVPSPTRTISTRRFLARSSGVSLETTGLLSPMPWADSRLWFTPCDAR